MEIQVRAGSSLDRVVIWVFPRETLQYRISEHGAARLMRESRIGR